MNLLDRETDDSVVEGKERLNAEESRNSTNGLAHWRNLRDLSESGQEPPFRLSVESEAATYQGAMRIASVRVSRVWVLLRLIRLLSAGAFFCMGVLWNRLTKKTILERQVLDAVRFRRLLERLGGVLIKVGQQLSQRADLLPPVYCDELNKLLDDIPKKIDNRDVLAALRRQMGRPLGEVFADFNFDPVGSASVACVYRAVLRTGDEVAVKVRRPRIQKHFTADLTALNWVLRAFEALSIWRPGLSDNLRFELRDSLLEELDFRIEARYQELFRRYHKRRKKLKVTSPKVYHELSGEEVLVSEFVTGWWVKDIIAALRRGDEEYLARLRGSRIDLRVIAKHLIRSAHYSFYECPFFHGDPHSANILLQPNNRIVLVDFGACGVFSQRDRNLMWHMNYYYSKEDVAGMVNMVISIMEPLAHIDINPFRKELLDAWWQGFYGIKSKHAQWWERTSFRLWLRFFELMRKYQIPVPRNVLRMIRATLLYDTVAAELYNKINVFKEFEKYSQDVARRARRRIEFSIFSQLLLGPSDSTFLKLQQIANVGNGLLYRVQKFLDDPAFSLAAMASKIYDAIRTFVSFLLALGLATLSGLILLALVHQDGIEMIRDPVRLWHAWQFPPPIKGPSEWLPPYSNGFVQLLITIWFGIVSVTVLIYGRRLRWRFKDVDVTDKQVR